MIKRLDTLEVATSDLADASSIYEKNFSFSVTRSADGKSAVVKVGSAEIRLVARSWSVVPGSQPQKYQV